MKNKEFEKEFLRALTQKVLQEDSVQPESLSAEENSIQISAKALDRRMQRHLKESRFLIAARKIGRAAAMLALVLLVSGGLLLGFSTTARAAFERWTHDIYENRIRYIFHGKPEEEYKLPLYEAGWLPEGVKLVEKQGDPLTYGYTYWYQNEDESIIILFNVDMVMEGSLLELIQMDGYELEIIQLEGRTVEDYFQGENDRTALWFEDHDRTIISIDCNLSREDLLNFIKNLRKID